MLASARLLCEYIDVKLRDGEAGGLNEVSRYMAELQGGHIMTEYFKHLHQWGLHLRLHL